MLPVVLVIHLFITLALIGIILMQKSEAGAFGDSSPNPFMSARARGDVMTQVTSILAALFICTSIILSIMTGANRQGAPASILDQPISAPSGLPLGVPGTSGSTPPAPALPTTPAPPSPGEAPKQ